MTKQTTKLPASKSNKYAIAGIAISVALVFIGAYIFLLAMSPKLPQIPLVSKSNIDLNVKDDSNDTRNRIQISKINIEVPFFTGNESVLEQGAWHRMPQNGDPITGGNFVLAAHRFELGLTPSGTKQKSPFYNIDKLNTGDEIKIFYQNKWYTYSVAKKYTVAPNAFYIEYKSDQPKLTLYSCTLNGANDGRDVIEALPIN